MSEQRTNEAVPGRCSPSLPKDIATGRRQEVLNRLCNMMDQAWKAIDPDANEPCDCACTDRGLTYQNSGAALDFMQAALAAAINGLHRPANAEPKLPTVTLDRWILEDLVALAEMDNEASQPGTDLYGVLMHAREALSPLPPWDPNCANCTSAYAGVVCRYHAARSIGEPVQRSAEAVNDDLRLALNDVARWALHDFRPGTEEHAAECSEPTPDRMRQCGYRSHEHPLKPSLGRFVLRAIENAGSRTETPIRQVYLVEQSSSSYGYDARVVAAFSDEDVAKNYAAAQLALTNDGEWNVCGMPVDEAESVLGKSGT